MRSRTHAERTTAWRVSIGTLSSDHHRIIASYSLFHAQSFLVVRSRAKFERARRELDKFNQEREESWDRRGFRHENRKPPSPHHMDGGINEGKGVAEFDLSALGRFQSIIMPSREPVSRTKENALTCWQVFLTLDTLMHPGSDSREEDTKLWLMHPALQLAFEAAYPPKNRAHRDLVAIDFGEFFAIGLGEEHFTRLLNLVDERCRELVTSDTMDQHWAASKKTPSQPLETEASSEKSDHGKEKSKPRDEDPLANPAFKSAYRISQAFDSLRWMFEERQDILATFIQQLGESVENLRPTIVRMRARRE